jgi:hypothetical protein
MSIESGTGSLLDELRKNEVQAAWLAYLEELGDPDFPIRLPDEQEMEAILRELDVPKEDIPAVLASRPNPTRDPEQWWLLERSVVELVSTMGSLDNPPWFPSPYTVAGMNPFFFVNVFVATLPHTRRYHREHGISAEIARATLADLGRNVRVNHKRHGEGGLEVSHWLMLHFRGRIYQLGRLQFERARLRERAVTSAKAHGFDASPDDLALSVHIPDFMGPMTPAACDASFAMAREFFPAHFPDEHIEWGVCSSWLLDPHLKDYLPPTSNIVQFQNRFVVAENDTNADSLVLQFVFGPAPADLDTLPQRSSLERAVVNHLKNGGHWQFRPGWFRWD